MVTVLVTGASGFIAGHCIEELLRHGYDVRGTVRSLAATGKVEHLSKLAAAGGGRVDLVEAELTSDRGWAEAVDGCTYVLHVASPNPPRLPSTDDDVIRPAVDGTRRVLRAAAASATVRRVVLTSSTSAIFAGHDPDDRTVRTETDWSHLDGTDAYTRSKTLAERCAWEVAEQTPDLELAVINAGLALGPLQRPESTTSIEVIRKLLAREVPAVPPIGFAPVDVRDLAVAHRLAMENPAAAGNRYICAGDHVWMRDMARTLAAEFGPLGFRVPTGTLPRWLMWTVARVDPTVRLAYNYVGRMQLVTAAKARHELGWTMRPVTDSVLDTGRSLVEHGLVRPKRKA
jgi:nucleoside-diphosphate-sugar epimerase